MTSRRRWFLQGLCSVIIDILGVIDRVIKLEYHRHLWGKLGDSLVQNGPDFLEIAELFTVNLDISLCNVNKETSVLHLVSNVRVMKFCPVLLWGCSPQFSAPLQVPFRKCGTGYPRPHFRSHLKGLIFPKLKSEACSDTNIQNIIWSKQFLQQLFVMNVRHFNTIRVKESVFFLNVCLFCV